MKLFMKLLAVIASGMIYGIAGLISGANFGGNYAVDFTFNGVRGYEAMGQIGLIVGTIGGGLLSWYLVFKPFREGKHRFSEKKRTND